MLIEHTPPEILMRARILGIQEPSCFNCALRNRKWSTEVEELEKFCEVNTKDPHPTLSNTDMHLCERWIC